MYYTFPTAELFIDQRHLKVSNVTFEVVEGTPDKIIKNDCLNGKFTIKGVLDNDCLASESKINKGKRWNLKVSHQDKFSIVPVLFLDLLDVTFVDHEPKMRRYSWLFCGIQRPKHDSIGLLPGVAEGEISLEELLEQIGFSRTDMEREKVKFDGEGGWK